MRGKPGSYGCMIKLITSLCLCLASAASVRATDSDFRDPFPPASARGEAVQPNESIAFFESFEKFGSTTPGVLGNAWKAKGDDKLPVVYALPEQLKTPPKALSIEWWMKRETNSKPPNGTLIHGPGFKISFLWNQTPNGSMHVKFQQALRGAWIGSVGPEIPLDKPDGQWHAYTTVFDLRAVAVYVDGEIYSREWQGNNADQIGPMCDGTNEPDKTSIELGGNSPGRWPDFGLPNLPVDEIRISTVALDAWQVRRNFENYRDTAVVFATPGAEANPSADGTKEHPLSLPAALANESAHTIALLPGTYKASEFQIKHGGPSPLERLLVTRVSGPVTIVADDKNGAAITGEGYAAVRGLTFQAAGAGVTALSIQKFQGAAQLECCRVESAGDGIAIQDSPGTRIENCVLSIKGTGVGIAVNSSKDVALINDTLVGGSAGASFGKSSTGAVVLNTIFSGQTRACLTIDEASLHALRGDGNVYAPSENAALARLGAKTYSVAELDAFRQRLYAIDFPQDKDKKLTAYGPENHSLALNVSFLDADKGDFRLAPVAGNPIDAGADFAAGDPSGMHRIEAPLYDINGARRPQGNAVDAGAYETAAPLQFQFTLDKAYTTSAGVYRDDGSLVRTLWSARALTAGPQSAYWNGLDDLGQIASDGEYAIKVAAHNIQYVWEGVIGNTSAKINGPTVHSAYLPIQSMAFAGDVGFYVTGYNEGGMTQFRFDVKNPQALTAKIGRPDYSRAFNLAATDGNFVYFADTHAPSYVVAAQVSDNKPVKFSSGKDVGPWSAIPVGPGNSKEEGVLGLAVQARGNLLFVAHSKENKIYIFDKRSGAAHGTLAVTSPGRIATDAVADGALWVCCQYEGKPAVVRFNSFESGAKPQVIINDVEAPAGVGVSPLDGSIVVADAGSSQQVKGFDPAGKRLWTYGQHGGYDNGPSVTTDKFFFKQTLIAFQADGSFWVKDEATNRVLHFSAERKYIDAIMFQPHPFVQTTDPNNPERAFINWLEFKIDYSKPLSEPGSWTLVNYWAHKLPVSAFNDFDDGLYRVVTLANGHTYGLILGGQFNAKKVVELLPAGLRLTAIPPLDGKIKMEDDGALTWVERVKDFAMFNRRDLAPFDLKSDTPDDPRWEAPRVAAQAPARWTQKEGGGGRWNGSDPVGDDIYFSQWRSQGENVISYNCERFSAGWHLGAARANRDSWLWRAAPSGPMDGHGTYDTNVEYAGRSHQVFGRHIFFNLHGEFWHNGQANQFFNYLDNGLFLGQFGQPNVWGVGSDAEQSRVPGAAGNSFAISLAHVGDRLYLYHNDENGHGGSQRWRIDGWNDIQEFIGKVKK